MNAEKISLLVPTMNRPEFLIRLLRYYVSTGFQGSICIGDSSDATGLEITHKALKSFEGKFNIIYREYPGVNNAVCLQRLIDLAPTHYCAFTADDDFLVPEALEKCAEFLETHPDYSAAHGQAVVIRLQKDGVYGRITAIYRYSQAQVQVETASRRLIDHLSNYQLTLFSVHRKETWREMYRNITSVTDIRFTELLPGCLTVIYGKVKELDGLYLVRQTHGTRIALPNRTEWLARPDYQSSYKGFRDILAQELAKKDNIGINKANALVEQSFLIYLDTIAEPLNYRLRIPRLMKAAAHIPGASQVWRALQWALRAVKLTGRSEIPLETLLGPSFPLHAGFLPVYHSLTESPSALPENNLT